MRKDLSISSVEGVVVQVLRQSRFTVKLDNDHQVLAHISGKLRKHFIKIAQGDRVKLDISSYNLNEGRITYRIGKARR